MPKFGWYEFVPRVFSLGAKLSSTYHARLNSMPWMFGDPSMELDRLYDCLLNATRHT